MYEYFKLTCGFGCINEIFRVLKELEFSECSEYRTHCLGLDSWLPLQLPQLNR